MSDIPIAQPFAVAGAVIANDTPCVNCGYNLRGLLPSGLCPECGSSILRSTQGDLLRYADPAWLRKLLLGVRLKLWNTLLGLVLWVLAGVATILLGRGGPLVVMGVQVVVSALGVLAVFLITTQEPRTALSEDPVTLRKAVRLCVIVALVGQLSFQLATILGPVVWLIVAGQAISLSGVVAYIGEFIYLRRFALRIPDLALARSTRIVMWGLAITMVLAVVFAIVMIFMVGSPAVGTPPFRPAIATSAPAAGLGATAGLMGVAVFGCVFGVAGLVFGVWHLVLLFGYRRAFREAIAAASAWLQAMEARVSST